MKRTTYNNQTYYNWGNGKRGELISIPEDAVIQYVDTIIEKSGKNLTLDLVIPFGNNLLTSSFTKAREIAMSEYFGSLMYRYQDELDQFPERNLYAMYKKRCKAK